jgi:hypothetical protein
MRPFYVLSGKFSQEIEWAEDKNIWKQNSVHILCCSKLHFPDLEEQQ